MSRRILFAEPHYVTWLVLNSESLHFQVLLRLQHCAITFNSFFPFYVHMHVCQSKHVDVRGHSVEVISPPGGFQVIRLANKHLLS